MTPDPGLLPGRVRKEVDAALRASEEGRIVGAEAVGGGCISHALRLDLDGAGKAFLKWNDSEPAEMFAAEADGLEALAAGTGEGLRVPTVLGRGSGEGGAPGWILLEFLPPSPPGPAYGERLGRGLAVLHRGRGTSDDAGWGWSRDNWIGSLPQANPRSDDWTSFWRDRRLAPQLRRAREAGRLGRREVQTLEELLGVLDGVLSEAEAEGPSLLHGDLWGGNVHPGPDGRPVLVDPAVYRGHREVDLAMAELFGFPAGAVAAYRESWPVDPAYDAVRRDLYQLYYLLVHVNLFGGGYVERTMRAARRVLADL